MENKRLEVRHPVVKSVQVRCTVFIAILLVALSIVSYLLYSFGMKGFYQEQMESVWKHANASIQHDELAECLKEQKESEGYQEMMETFNGYVDNYGVDRIDIVLPMQEGEIYQAVYALSGSSRHERETHPDAIKSLGDVTHAPEEQAMIYELLNAMTRKRTLFLTRRTENGLAYLYAKAVCTSDSLPYGMLCIGFTSDKVTTFVHDNTLFLMALIMVFGFVFIRLFMNWMRKNVTEPLEALEWCAKDFAQRAHGSHNPNDLVLEVPNIEAQNEIQVLALSVRNMSIDMRDYVMDMLEAERQVSEMNAIAYEDPLTHMGNRLAYDKIVEDLNKRIAEKTAKFAIIMIDLNRLKTVNDIYGHDRGNEYIVGSCDILASVGMPVFRIGGDEFVMLLKDSAYEEREAILDTLRKSFRKYATDSSRPIWHRYSAAIGMACLESQDESVETVFKRADEAMYENKKEVKKYM